MGGAKGGGGGGGSGESDPGRSSPCDLEHEERAQGRAPRRSASHRRAARPARPGRRRANVHVTLKFLADLSVDAVAPLAKAQLEALVDPAKKAPKPGTCRLDAFPSVEQANVIVIELTDPQGDLSKLASKIEKLASRHGIARESRAFRPHVTLARLKRPYDSRRWLKPELAEAVGELTVARLTLYRSDLGAGKDGGHRV